MLKKILLAILLLVVAFAGYVATRPGTFRITRTAVVAAPPSEVFPRLSDFRRWEAWSPWAKLDPAMKVDYPGTQGQPGGGYHWVGNDKVGEGRMTLTSVEPDRALAIRLEFIKPWAQVNATTFDLAPEGAGTRVTWTMTGDLDFVGKLFAVFMNMDRVIGADFEKGLARLRETQPR
jgi:hypothetical protein